MTTPRQKRYWRINLRITASLLAVWLLTGFVTVWYARELNQIDLFGLRELLGPLGFYMAAQGALLVFLAIIGFHAWYMNRIDREQKARNRPAPSVNEHHSQERRSMP